MSRGMAKKIYTAGKRSEKSRINLINDIRSALKESEKLDDSAKKVLDDLEGKI